MKKIISFLLSLILVCGLFAAPVFAFENASVICSFDTYTEDNQFQTKDFTKSEVLLCGNVYNRQAILTFNIKALEKTDYQGCILEFWVRNNISESKILLYDKNDNQITSLSLDKTGLIKCSLDVTSYVKELLALCENELFIKMSYSGSVLTIFSSEYTKDKTKRPQIITSDMTPYVPGQRSFEYPIVTKDDFQNELSQMVLKGHPYLYGTREDFNRIKENAFGKNKELTSFYSNIKSIAQNYVDNEPSPITVDITKTANFNRAQECYVVISNCSFVYLIEGDESYAKRAWKEAEYFANLSTWGTVQFIDNNQIAFGIALCYDWLYDWLDDVKKEKLISSLNSKHLDEIEDLFKNRTASKYNTTNHKWYFDYNNHATLNNSLTFVQAMALADINIEKSAYIMAESLNNLKRAFDKCYPDSAWYEGISYWSNVGPRFADIFMCMQNSFGHIFGYEKIPSVMNQADFPIYIGSSVSSFCFNDSVQSARNKNSVKYVYGILNNDKALQKYSLENDTFNSPFTILFYDVNSDYSDTQISLSKDKFFRNMDMVTMRSSWNSTNEIFTGMVVQNAKLTHAHMNSGTICLDALGEQWITNPGRDDYNLDGYWESAQNGKRWQYYFGRAEANSCLVIAPSTDGGQIVDSNDTIDKYITKQSGSYAITDLTATYAPYATSYKRGIMLCDDRSKFVLQDELSLKSSQEVYSFINIFKCDAEISDDQKSIILSKNNKKVKVNILCDDEYELSIMNSKPLPTSPQVSGNMAIRTIKKIAVHFQKTKGFNLRMEFTPYLLDEELSQAPDTIEKMDNWIIPDTPYTEPSLKTLIADGEIIDAFNPYNRCYSVNELPSSLVATADEIYSVSYKDSDDGLSKYVILTNKETGRKTAFMVSKFTDNKAPAVIDVSSYNNLYVNSVKASSDDGNVAQNTIDKNGDTRWSASGEQYITFELKKLSSVNCIAIKFYNGNKRNSYFDLQVSEDSKIWKTISENESSGNTNDFEYFTLNNEKAKFVRYIGYGTSSGTWNSLCEVEFYGK